MEAWRGDDYLAPRPKVMGPGSVILAILLHIALFLVLWVGASILRNTDEPPIPIDLTVVVVENLKGNEEEPPPLKPPEPEPPPPPPEPPKPAPPKKVEPPKELEQVVTNFVKKTEKKEEKKVEPPKEEPPKKTKAELRKERLEAMRKEAKTVKSTTKIVERQPNGRTDRKTLSDAEIQKLLNMGYKPGRSEQLAANEEQRCYSLIKMAIEAKWDRPPWTDTLKPMVIRIWFGSGGRIVRTNLEQSSGDSRADQTVLRAARDAGSVLGLSADFLSSKQSIGVPIRFKVTPQ